jgi:hypothetical protein
MAGVYLECNVMESGRKSVSDFRRFYTPLIADHTSLSNQGSISSSLALLLFSGSQVNIERIKYQRPKGCQDPRRRCVPCSLAGWYAESAELVTRTSRETKRRRTVAGLYTSLRPACASSDSRLVMSTQRVLSVRKGKLPEQAHFGPRGRS